MSVYYRCKFCRHEHPPPVSFAEKIYFDTSATLDLGFECPQTGQSARYNRTDLLWRDTETAGSSTSFESQ
jgi:hypothetical protein